MLHPGYTYTLMVNCFCSPQVGCLFFVLIGLTSAHPIFFELFNKGHLFWKEQKPAVFVVPDTYPAPSTYPVTQISPKPQTPSLVYGPPELPVLDITSGSVTSMSVTTIRPSQQTEVDVEPSELSEVVDVRVIDFPLPESK